MSCKHSTRLSKKSWEEPKRQCKRFELNLKSNRSMISRLKINWMRDFWNQKRNALSPEIRTERVHQTPTTSYQVIKREKELMKILSNKARMKRKNPVRSLKTKKKMMIVTVIFERNESIALFMLEKLCKICLSLLTNDIKLLELFFGSS